MNSIFKSVTIVLAAFFIILIHQGQAEAQNLRIVSVNTFTGALTGTALGGATIALQNKSDIDYYPLRFGVGMGTIFGLGTGFYDLTYSSGSSGFYVNGLISSANTSGTIILMDTFYGAATGAVVGAAVSLMTNDRIIKGIQFGTGAGAWAGFTFGIADAFFIGTPGGYDDFYDDYAFNQHSQSSDTGIINVTFDKDNYHIGFLSPILFNTPSLDPHSGLKSKTNIGLELTRINISL